MATTYKRLSFTNDEECRLIELVRQQPGLWDSKSKEYGNLELRKCRWQVISENLKKPVYECQRKWRFIRDYYIHKRKRVFTCSKGRRGKYFNLGFLNNIAVRKLIRQKSRYNASIEYTGAEDYHTENADFDASMNSEFGIFVSNINYDKSQTNPNGKYDVADDNLKPVDDDDDDDDNNGETAKIAGNNNSATKGNGHWPSSGNSDEELEYTIEHVADDNEEGYEDKDGVTVNSNDFLMMGTDAPATKVTKSARQDEAIDLFFQSMAATVKTFPPNFAARAKMQVFRVINVLELMVHTNNK